MTSKRKTNKTNKTNKAEASERKPAKKSGSKVELTREDIELSFSSDSLTRKIPALGEYINSIGAEELNFRKFIVREFNETRRHYYTEKTIIEINTDGSIWCSREDMAPSDDQRKVIQEAFQKVTLPKSVTCSLVNAKQKVEELRTEREGKGWEGAEFIFVQRVPGKDEIKVRMIQQTIRYKGEKYYIPWSYWGDKKWRKMEPDGRLPIWKPYQNRGKSKLMIHEGAKSAAFIDDLLYNDDRKDERLAHPWYDDLKNFEHWGMIGGALAPGRTDYSEVHNSAYQDVFYACDRDAPGEAALQIVSQHYGRSLYGIRFGSKFPESWDMADPMPEKMFREGRDGKPRWVGPTLPELYNPATWATEVIPPPPGTKGRSHFEITRAFREQWVHSVQPEMFIHTKWPNTMYVEKEFDSFVRPYSFSDGTARIMRKVDASKVTFLRYEPDQSTGVHASKQGRYFNTYMPPSIEPKDGDPKPFLDFIEMLIIDPKDRHEVLRWCATLIARPDIRMGYALLLISEMQGVGKTTLGRVLSKLVGQTNVSWPSEVDIVESAFNSWLAHVRLAIVNEIYAGHSDQAYNRLKSVIVDDDITVNKKHITPYTINNWVHIFACSNSLRAIQLKDEDRRWLVPHVTEKKQDVLYWDDLNEWLDYENGYGIVMKWAIDFVKEKGNLVRKGSHAPHSKVKQDAIEAGDSPATMKVRTLLRQIKSILSGDSDDSAQMIERWESEGTLVDGKIVLVDIQLVNYVINVVYSGKPPRYTEKALSLRRLARAEGFLIGEHRVPPGMKSDGWGEYSGGRIITLSKELVKMTPSMIGGHGAAKGKSLQPLKIESWGGNTI